MREQTNNQTKKQIGREHSTRPALFRTSADISRRLLSQSMNDMNTMAEKREKVSLILNVRLLLSY